MKGDLSEIEMREVKRILEENKAVILQQLELFYKGKQVKAIKK